MMIEAEVLIPLRDNDGDHFSPVTVEELERRLFDLAGGLTIYEGARGRWRAENGTIHMDQSDRYVVALGSWTQIPEFIAIVRWARLSFRQEAL